MTRSQIDKLGERLRAGRRDEEVLRRLDDLYTSYEQAEANVSSAVFQTAVQYGNVDWVLGPVGSSSPIG